MIDIYIEGGGDAEATRRCEARVRAASTAIAYRFVASAEPAGHDMVLLDAGATVPDRWLDRLSACAARESGVATISSFSNVAWFCGYPYPGGAPEVPSIEEARALDACFQAENAGETVDLPCGERGCLYVTDAALRAAGPLDSAARPEFFERAKAAGLRHVLCGELFVRVDAAPRTSPPESFAVRDFVSREPTRPLRRRVDMARLRASARPLLLMVTHRWGGGVERHVADLIRLVGDACEVLTLRPDGADAVELRWMRAGEDFSAWFDRAEWAEGVGLLASLGLDRLHFHHVHGLPQEVLDLPGRLGVPFDVTLHDYFPICPRYHLSPAGTGSCADGAAECERCLDDGPAPWGLGLAQWRERFGRFLAEAERVIVPSRDMAVRLRRYLPGVALLEWPHPEFVAAPAAVHKVLLLGSISAIKGARLLEACAADARARALPLHFHVLGNVDRPMATFPRVPLTIGGSYADDQLAMHLAIERPDAILFLSQVPETYSYTLSAAMHTGLPIVATRIGAFIERLAHYPDHVLLPPDAGPAAVNDALLARLARAARVLPARAS